MNRWVLFIGLFSLLVANVQAHEMRPGYLEIKEVTPATYSVLW